jgi:hypothetical protein
MEELKSTSQLISAFFILSPEEASISRLNLFSQIHDIIFHGKGGFDWETVYNMPIWLRNFTYKRIEDYYQKEAEAMEDKSSKGSSNTKTLINPADFINAKKPIKY